MNHSALTPIFTVLRILLHVLVTGLGLFVLLHAGFGIGAGGRVHPATVVVAALFLATYASAGPLHRRLRGPRRQALWLAVICAGWAVLTALAPEASYLVFPLFFLMLHLLPRAAAVAAVAASTGYAVLVLGGTLGWSPGVVIGPVIGAGVAVAIASGYAAMFRESRERDLLIEDLRATRRRLARVERDAGVQAERSRLAREIHDTLAQGLSSIQLLLHAAERADPDGAGIAHVRLARETASANLEEARRFIRELAPAPLEGVSLADALRRAAATAEHATDGLAVTVRVSGDPAPLPTPIEVALLRIAQASLANIRLHAHAAVADVTLTYMGDEVSLDVVDDGRGFDVDAIGVRPDGSASFGITSIRERAAALGGRVSVESSPGSGTAIAVSFPLAPDPAPPAPPSQSPAHPRHDAGAR